MRRGIGYLVGLGILVLLIVLTSFTTIINFITDYMWFKELGYTETFLIKLKTQLKIGIPLFLILTGLVGFYLLSIKKSYYKRGSIIANKKSERKLNTLIWVASAFVSFFMSSMFTGSLWFDTLEFLNSTNFNVKDPIFNNDISFYIFKLPLINEVLSLLLLFMFILIILTVVFYLILLSIRRPVQFGEEDNFGNVLDTKNINLLFNKRILKTALLQIGIIGFLIFLIIGISQILKSYGLLYSPRGIVFGASYTDIHVNLWLYRIMAILAVISAIGFLLGVMRKKIKLALIGPVLLIAVSILGNIAAGLVQQFIVSPNEIAKERKYIEYNIEYTQKAYGINEVKEKEFPVEQNLTKEDIFQNEETVKNIRINDYRPTKSVYNQLQGIRLYYKFNDVDIDRYVIDGKYTQVFLSARELDQSRLTQQAQTWVNKHLKYTHGYGFTLSPVNSVTEEGQPRLLVSNIPPETETDLNIKRPEIYFGELDNEYVIVNTDEEEFDYPQGENNKMTTYQGKAGIKLGGINKLLFAIKQGSLKLLVSGSINSDSRILIYRNIMERVNKIAPFIEYDSDPYLVLNQDNGKLYWIIDGYTISSRYPYSQPYKDTNLNYIRNSVKVVVDAYNGETKFYIFDKEDPIIQTYRKIFPDLFLDSEEMPEGLRSHVRYPTLLFDVQSEIYRVYHIDNPMVFYNGEDIWDIAKEKYVNEQQNVEPNYVMFKLPDEDKVEFLLTVPYTPKERPNMTALFVARNDGENYGKLFIYKLPKSKTISGPMLIENRIDQDTEISQQLTLWGQEGSDVIRGNLLIVPVENSLLYVEPIYLQASSENSLPEVKRIIVAYRNQIVMERTLDEALSKIFGRVEREENEDGIIDDVDDDITDENIRDIIIRANEIFERARKASQQGNWAEYGEYLNQLENILNRLSRSAEDNNIEQ
ncbi:UPF0182 family protein [Thermohalobacter berrensis]|uniref:UPF0182 protein BET03_06875 n=1 Tax=Thermohalobacter berrensis TaxID=99594 RepID=A0A419STZ4_9FIRM|nr:UPF0182 family protein [Thermohalobacter berrensis]RKD28757.1 hypothetical protein BET03_06875 [Thermohalobacter berrensis]